MRRVDLSQVEVEGVSHNPGIPKRVLLRNGEVPHITTFAQARFLPGQQCEAHVHATMYEIYLVESGRGKVIVGGKTHELIPGVCVVVEPGERHQVINTSTDELVLSYFGVAVP